ncbi:GntR family transcriptional regulator [Marinomonas transparens]|uniref:GntR family transcriptional regulator n=1 Tax=Marinomonas transparens TaxID=2795388 RepID=A0A934JQA6_9GAMM|nr:GntR family transcriptional regulator [Marinomonas transparens]MBJ7538109.1 GntR family transcriptional regulator [Marinomonas transparens]
MKNSDIIASTLEESILRGDYQTGERLNEVALSTEFGVSRTPIREALQKLTKSGLVEQIHRKGVFVRQPGPVELIELFEMMAELEASCGRLAALRISEVALEKLREANGKCKIAMTAGEADTYYYANEVFHMIIYRESGNSILEQETKRLHQRLKPYRRLQLQVRGRMPQSMSEHEQIVEALTQGESDKAAQLLRGHVTIQGEKFRHLLSALKK